MSKGTHNLVTIKNVRARLLTACDWIDVLLKEMNTQSVKELRIDGQAELVRAVNRIETWAQDGSKALKLHMMEQLCIDGDMLPSTPNKKLNGRKRPPAKLTGLKKRNGRTTPR